MHSEFNLSGRRQTCELDWEGTLSPCMHVSFPSTMHVILRDSFLHSWENQIKGTEASTFVHGFWLGKLGSTFSDCWEGWVEQLLIKKAKAGSCSVAFNLRALLFFLSRLDGCSRMYSYFWSMMVDHYFSPECILKSSVFKRLQFICICTYCLHVFKLNNI